MGEDDDGTRRLAACRVAILARRTARVRLPLRRPACGWPSRADPRTTPALAWAAGGSVKEAPTPRPHQAHELGRRNCRHPPRQRLGRPDTGRNKGARVPELTRDTPQAPRATPLLRRSRLLPGAVAWPAPAARLPPH